MGKLDDVISRCDSWEESKHPRDPDGKFGSGSGGGKSGSEPDRIPMTPRAKELNAAAAAPAHLSPEQQQNYRHARVSRMMGDTWVFSWTVGPQRESVTATIHGKSEEEARKKGLKALLDKYGSKLGQSPLSPKLSK